MEKIREGKNNVPSWLGVAVETQLRATQFLAPFNGVTFLLASTLVCNVICKVAL